MSIHARMKVLDLMEDHPEVDEVFETYGVEVTDDVMAMTLKELCKDEGINYWELKSDIVEAVGWDGSADNGDDEEEEEDWDDDDDDGDGDDDDGDDDDGDDDGDDKDLLDDDDEEDVLGDDEEDPDDYLDDD